MYYKIFKKDNKFEVFHFNEKENNYIDFIKEVTSKGYRQYIVTTDLMIDIIQYIVNKEGQLKDVEVNKDIYDESTVRMFEHLPIKLKQDKHFNIKKNIQHDFQNSIEIIGIKVKYDNIYFGILANGIVTIDEDFTNFPLLITELLKDVKIENH